MFNHFGTREPLSGAKIVREPFESIDSTLRRFKKAVQKAGILTDARRHQYFVPKSERRRIKSIKARTRRGL
jgi:small subunit ribosomal protein S21